MLYTAASVFLYDNFFILNKFGTKFFKITHITKKIIWTIYINFLKVIIYIFNKMLF